MHKQRNGLVSATRFMRKLRGGSQPILIGASDGKQYVVKFANNLQGPNVLCNEVLGTEIYRAIGLPSPAWKPIAVTERFIEENPASWFEGPSGRIRPEAGQCFGSELIGNATSSLFEILPGPYWGRVSNRLDFWLAWVVDLCAEHWDNRQAVFLEDCGVLYAIFIDHGHMFGGPYGSRTTPLSGPRHLDRRAYGKLDRQAQLQLHLFWADINADELFQKSMMVPDKWATDAAVRNFVTCIEKLSRADTWRHSLEAMVASFEIPDAHANTFPNVDRVLRPHLRFAIPRRNGVA